MATKTPIFFLKTKSTPGDAYEEFFTSPPDGASFEPSFVPVLKHQFDEAGMSTLRNALKSKSVGTTSGSAYGGIIFTSQRAVEAFTKVVEEGKGEISASAAGNAIAKVSNPQVRMMAGHISRTFPSIVLGQPLLVPSRLSPKCLLCKFLASTRV